MSDPAPAQEWWSAAELANAGLPDVPGTKRKVNEMARREGWPGSPGKVRRRRGAGGGLEYHWSVLPLRARLRLASDHPSRAAARPSAEEACARSSRRRRPATSSRTRRKEAMSWTT